MLDAAEPNVADWLAGEDKINARTAMAA